jgi:hypothetical protein
MGEPGRSARSNPSQTQPQLKEKALRSLGGLNYQASCSSGGRDSKPSIKDDIGLANGTATAASAGTAVP